MKLYDLHMSETSEDGLGREQYYVCRLMVIRNISQNYHSMIFQPYCAAELYTNEIITLKMRPHYTLHTGLKDVFMIK